MNIIKNISQIILCLAIALSIPPGYAEDIDIYSRPPVATPDPNLNPNVLIVIDNSANWASASQHWPGGIKQGEAELNALRTVIGELSDRTNVGLMMFTPGTGSNKNGGYVRFHVRQMTAANKSAFSSLVGFPSGCTDGANSLNGTPNCILKNFNSSEKVASAQTDYSAVMLDVFKYFGGYTSPAHAQDDVAASSVYGSSVENSSQFGTLRYAGDFDVASLGKFDSAAYTDALKTNYNSPLSSSNNCAKNYVIFIGNGFPSQDAPSMLLGPPGSLPGSGVGGDVTQLPLANLASTTTTQIVLLATPACGTYSGADAAASLAACNADTNLSTQYPGYSNYNCTSATTCSAGSTTTTTTVLGNSACGTYATQAACQAASPWGFSGYTSYSCSAGTACTATSANPTNPIAADTGYISTDLSNATNCTAYGNANYPSYSGFSCTSLGAKGNLTPTTGCIGLANESACTTYATNNAPYSAYGLFTCTSVANCGGGLGKDWQISSNYKHWRIDATTKITTGNTYVMNGITTTTVSSNTYSQYINGTSTTTAAEPIGTFSAPTVAKTNYFDEWARFLHQTDVSPALGKQNLNTFTIDVFKDAQDTDETSLLISAASAGGGKYFKASDENAITNALRKIFSEIQSVNSVFASSSLPVSVNTQGTYLNQVFMGMFRPEGGAAPRWPGNLKQYKFKIFNGVLRLSDQNGDEAISTTTGFVTPCADSFWTSDTGQYWNFGGSLALGDCAAQSSAFPAAGSTSVYSDGPDGEVVEKGGAAQRLRGVYSSGGTLVSSSTNYSVCTGAQTPSTASCRLLKTCSGTSATSCTTLTSFDTTNAAINATTLNLADATQRDNLINWARGQDIDNENANLDAGLSPILNEMRPSVHGGVVHSQPAVIDYGGTTGTIAFYGADDGVFHAVDGGQGASDGVELWGFIAPETMRKLNRLRENSPPVAFPGVTGSPPPTPKDYFFDGSTGVYQNSGTVWIYPSMRRGGRSIYAFNVSSPASPVLKWRKGCFTSDTTDDTVCSTGWTGIGQTWSNPHIAYLSGYVDGSNPKPVLVFGGGYDQCEDTNSQTRCTGVRKGANIWFVDADTGTVIRTYPTHYSVPGDVALLKDPNGYLTYVYASDTGGNVYRINVGSTNTAGTDFPAWSSSSAASQIILASMSETNHARKFLNGPSIVLSSGFNAVLLGSGDREHPLVTDYACGNYSTTLGSYVTNQFYMYMDKPPGYPIPVVTPADLVNVTSGMTTIATVSGTTTITNVLSEVTTTSTKGWRFNFGSCEQTVNEALTFAGVTYFGTNAPSATTGTSCTANLGIARGYAVDYLTANPIPSSAEVAAALAAAATTGSDGGPGSGVGAVGEVVNGAIAGLAGGSRNSEYLGGGMPPSPVAGVVDIEGTKYPFCIGCIDTSAASSSALEGREPPINPPSSRYRSYWYIETD